MELVDSHCHLNDEQFAPDRSAVIERAFALGLKYLLEIGTGDGPPDLSAAIRVADTDPRIFATAGVHPNDSAKVAANTLQDLTALLGHPKVKAVGEIGLDYHWGVPKDLQLPLFSAQLAIAAGKGMPVVIHTRDAWDDTIDVLRNEWKPAGVPGVMHCFTGDETNVRECLDLGMYVALGGVVTFSRNTALRAAARLIPADRLLLETDAPYLAPAPHRGKRNEPAFVAHTAQVVAEARQVPLEELAHQTTENFERLFGLGGSGK